MISPSCDVQIMANQMMAYVSVKVRWLASASPLLVGLDLPICSREVDGNGDAKIQRERELQRDPVADRHLFGTGLNIGLEPWKRKGSNEARSNILSFLPRGMPWWGRFTPNIMFDYWNCRSCFFTIFWNRWHCNFRNTAEEARQKPEWQSLIKSILPLHGHCIVLTHCHFITAT